MSEENPYAAPTTVPEEARHSPDPFGWRVEGKRLVAEKVAQLPMIDPYTGESELVMEMRRVVVPYRPHWMVAIPLGAMGLGGLVGVAAGWEVVVVTSVLGLLLGGLAASILGRFMPVCVLRVFFTKRTRRRMRFFVTVPAMMVIVGLVGIFAAHGLPDEISGIPLVVFLLGVVMSSIGQRHFVNRLKCRRMVNDTWMIQGFQREAIARLRDMEPTTTSQEPKRNVEFLR